MPRPKEFDVDHALRRALEVFWAKGYEATSVQDLVDAMGIQRASLYGTFGDKHSLYLQALRHYQQQSLVEMERSLAAAASPLAGLKALLTGIADGAAGRNGRRGCFCVNANVELAPVDHEVGGQVRQHSEQVEALLTRTLEAARTAGELPPRVDCLALATFVFGSILALNVLGKQRASRDRLQAVVQHTLAALAPAG